MRLYRTARFRGPWRTLITVINIKHWTIFRKWIILIIDPLWVIFDSVHTHGPHFTNFISMNLINLLLFFIFAFLFFSFLYISWPRRRFFFILIIIASFRFVNFRIRIILVRTKWFVSGRLIWFLILRKGNFNTHQSLHIILKFALLLVKDRYEIRIK